MTEVLRVAAAFLIWPGLISAALLGWLYLWLGRKTFARLQARQGPPFYQPFFDFVKLMGKQTVLPRGVNAGLFALLPWLSLAAMIFALALLPVPGTSSLSFSGDLILLLYLLEVPSLIEVVAGFTTRSVYGQVGAMREAIMTLGYNLPFITAFIALAIQGQSSNMRELLARPLGPTHLFAAIALFLAIPARMKMNPFSIANAEQEIVAGPLVEYNGRPLGIFELVHGLELVAMAGLFASLVSGSVQNPVIGMVVYLLVSMLVVVATTLLSAATARLKVQHALGFYWRWGALAAAAAVLVAAFLK